MTNQNTPEHETAVIVAVLGDPEIGERARQIIREVVDAMPDPTSEDRAVTPTEPGLYLDKWGNVWHLHADGVFAMTSRIRASAARYAPFKRLEVVGERPASGVAPQEPECTCTAYSEDRGGGHFELMLDPEPGCPEHGESIAAPQDTADTEDLGEAFDQLRAEFDSYRYAVRCGIQRVRNVVASSGTATPSEVLESLAYVGVPPELVPARMEGVAPQEPSGGEHDWDSLDNCRRCGRGFVGDRANMSVKDCRPAPSPDREKLGALIRDIYRERGFYTEDQVLADLILDRFPALAAPVAVDRERLRKTIAPVLFNSMNYPEPHRMMGKPFAKLETALLDALELGLGGGER